MFAEVQTVMSPGPAYYYVFFVIELGAGLAAKIREDIDALVSDYSNRISFVEQPVARLHVARICLRQKYGDAARALSHYRPGSPAQQNVYLRAE